MIKIKDLKVGQHFQMEGLDVDGNQVFANCTLRSYLGMDKYVVESDGITILYRGDDEVVSEVYK